MVGSNYQQALDAIRRSDYEKVRALGAAGYRPVGHEVMALLNACEQPYNAVMLEFVIRHLMGGVEVEIHAYL